MPQAKATTSSLKTQACGWHFNRHRCERSAASMILLRLAVPCRCTQVHERCSLRLSPTQVCATALHSLLTSDFGGLGSKADLRVTAAVAAAASVPNSSTCTTACTHVTVAANAQRGGRDSSSWFVTAAPLNPSRECFLSIQCMGKHAPGGSQAPSR
jgi:hypothetical protein